MRLHRLLQFERLTSKIRAGGGQVGPCLTDAARESRSRQTVRVFAAMLPIERVLQQSSRPFDPVEALKPPRHKSPMKFCAKFLDCQASCRGSAVVHRAFSGYSAHSPL